LYLFRSMFKSLEIPAHTEIVHASTSFDLIHLLGQAA
jgi:hypothetical protein